LDLELSAILMTQGNAYVITKRPQKKYKHIYDSWTATVITNYLSNSIKILNGTLVTCESELVFFERAMSKQSQKMWIDL